MGQDFEKYEEWFDLTSIPSIDGQEGVLKISIEVRSTYKKNVGWIRDERFPLREKIEGWKPLNFEENLQLQGDTDE